MGSVVYGLYSQFVFPDYVGKLYYSSNNGDNWSSFPYDSMLSYSTSIINLGSVLYVSRGQGISIVKSTNNGASWMPAIQGLTSFAVNKLFSDGTNIFAGTENGIFVSTDAGANWASFSSGIFPVVGTIKVRGGFCVNNGFIYAGANGVWKRPLVQVGINTITGEIPNRFSLTQNFPNPFNPSTKIKFDIPNSGITSLKVYDILGREVEVLVNELLKTGTYEADFNANRLASGVYFYRLVSGEYSETKKMVLVK